MAAHEHHHHAHGHEHSHGLSHGHAHAPASYGRAFAIGIALNIGFVVVEAGFGLYANSMALLADAGHNLSDVLGLVLAWGAAALSKWQPTRRFTYGLRSSSILAALANALLLFVAIGGIVWEAILRFKSPEPVAAGIVMAVAAIGVVINTATALLFMRGQKHDLNIRGAFLHMAADAAISLGVVIAGLALMWTGWLWLDPLVSLAISAVIVVATWALLRESVDLALHAVPRNIDSEGVRRYIAALPGVESLHDLHIWPLSTTETALTCHLVMPAGHPGDAFLDRAAHELGRAHGISHATFQIELGNGPRCALEPDTVV
ncbi:MAG: cation diffusion facilitator family transporter [Hyphomicrobiaceae bacterium]